MKNILSRVTRAMRLSMALILGFATSSALATMSETYDIQIYGATFESTQDSGVNDYQYILGTEIASGDYATGSVGWFAGQDDASAISNRLDQVGGQLLHVETNGSTLTNVLDSAVTNSIASALAEESLSDVTKNSSAFIEAEVAFVAADAFDPGFIGGETSAKFAIYAYCANEVGNSVTNLVVYHGYIDGGQIAYTNEIFDSVELAPDALANVRVELKKATVLGSEHNVFSVTIDGNTLESATATEDNIWFITTEAQDAPANISYMTISGSGEIDNIKVGQVCVDTYAAIVDGDKYATWTAATNAIVNGSSFVAYENGTIDLASGSINLTTNSYVVTVTTSAPGKKIVDNGDGTWSVEDDIIPVATVFTVANNGATTNTIGNYASLAAAVEAAPAGATVLLLADDNASFASDGIVIDKNLTIDGNGHAINGDSAGPVQNVTANAQGDDVEFDGVNGSNVHGFFVKSGDVTFKNVSLTEFGDSDYVNKFGYTPIQTASAYTGALVLENVNIDKFNRTAVCVRGGTLTMVGGTITANAENKDVGKGKDNFQQPIEIRGGTALIDGVTVNSTGYPYATNGGGAIVAWSDTTLTNVVVDFTGVGIWADYEDIAIVGENTSIEATDKALFVEDGGSITVSDGDFAGMLAVDAVAGSSITVNGGTFDAPVPAEFAGANLAPTTVAEDGKYTVKTARTVAFTVDSASYTNIVVADGETVARPADPVSDAYAFTGWTLNGVAYDFATPVTADINLEATIISLTAAKWIGGASGNWKEAANWDIGYVPTKATVVTFTNDAEVAISNTDACKGMVLDNAAVLLVRTSGEGAPILRFYGNGDSAVSVASGKTGSLAVNDITLFNERVNYTDLMIGSAFEVKGDVSFRGISIVDGSRSASFAITGKTTVSANAKVRTIDWANTKFQGGIEVAPGVVAKISTQPNGKATIGNGITLVANENPGDHAAVWLMQYKANSGGVELTGGASVAVDANHAATCYVKTTSSGGLVDDVWCDVYELYRKRTVTRVTFAEGLAVTGVTPGQRVAPGEELAIGVSGVAEGYEPSVTITKHSGSSVLTTNAVSFTYTMPDFDIDISAIAVPRGFQPGETVAGVTITGDQATWLNTYATSVGKDKTSLLNDLQEGWEAKYLLNVDPISGSGTLMVSSINVSGSSVIVTVGIERTGKLSEVSNPINGILKVSGAASLSDEFEEIANVDITDGTFPTDAVEATATVSDVGEARFFRAVIVKDPSKE